MSGNFRFSKEIMVALSQNQPVRDRRWAVWRCAYCVARVARCDADEIYQCLADCVGFNRDKNPCAGRMPSSEQIVFGAGVLVHVRFRLLEKLREYELKRKARKLSGRRFPVVEFSEKEFVLTEIEKMTKKYDSLR